MNRVKKLFIVAITITATICTAVPTFAASKKASKQAIDPTLAVPPAFSTSQYAVLNPTIAAQYGNDITKMYNHYLTDGVRKGERLYATLLPMPMEKLFLYMSYNRQDYIKKGLNATYPYFNLQNYIAQNPTLVPLYGSNYALYLYHYVNFGIYEGKPSGSLTDPAKVITWNSAIAELNNAKMSPAKIIGNYTAVTGQMTTALLTTPIKAPTTPAAPTCQPTNRHHEHDWKYESIDDDKHWKECRNCDEKYKEDHHYHVKSQTNGRDTSRHLLKCSKCDHKYAEFHYDRNRDGKCDICGYITGHIHHYVPQSTGQTATQHVLLCSCGATMMENHTHTYAYTGSGSTHVHQDKCPICNFVIDSSQACDINGIGGSCSKCGHLNGVIPPSHTHSYNNTWSDNGNGTHSRYCIADDCPDRPGSKQTRDCSPNGAGQTCTTCGHTFPAAPTHTHTYNDTWSDNGNGTHSRYCTAADCPDHDGSKQTEDCSPNGAGQTCIKCGHTFPVAHSHSYNDTWSDNGNGTHSRYCIDSECSDRDGSKQTEDCSPNGAGQTCATCGHSFPAAHTHTYDDHWTDNNNGTHSRYCTATDCPDHEGSKQTEDCDPNYEGSQCSTCGHMF